MFSILGSILLILFTATDPDKIRESLEELSQDLKETVEIRNFHKAKHILHKMLPLMKKEIKFDKQQIISFQKQNEDCDKEIIEKNELIKTKIQSLEYTKTLLHTSSAAIRAKSNELMVNIDKYLLATL